MEPVALTAWATFALAVFTAVLAIATAVLAKVSYWTTKAQLQASSRALGVDIVLRLDDRFQSSEMKQVRQRVMDNLTREPNLDPVLDFFETVGYLTREQVLDEKLVYNTFFHLVHHYRYIAKDYIAAERRESPQIWEDFLYLHEQLLKHERAKAPVGEDLVPTTDDLADFVRAELDLVQRKID